MSAIYSYGARFALPQHPNSYSSLTIKGRIAADNSADMRLNGTLIASCGPNCFGTLTTIPAPATSLFNLGQNLLWIDVNNQGGPSGLYVGAIVHAVC